ncbi:MAG: 2-amino-4-hydroxy-6-hydroxymethyldihydropteridine diphosphokinase [Baekduia sp.]
MLHGHLLLGSNLGDPPAQLDKALASLPSRGIEVTGVSSYYETTPVGAVADQPPFINAAATFETALEPLALLEALKQIESAAGRETDPSAAAYVKDGPRALDLDIALLGAVVVDDERLTVPHPRLLERRFALIPLLELDFGLTLPDGRRLSGALAALPLGGQDVRLRRSARGAASAP